MNWDDEAELEPLGEYEQDMLDRLKLPEGPRGCHWIGDDAQHCNKPLARLPSRAPYCEEHLRRSLTEKGWQRMLERVGRVPDWRAAGSLVLRRMGRLVRAKTHGTKSGTGAPISPDDLQTFLEASANMPPDKPRFIA